MKNKLFIPRKIEGEGSRWEQWNKIQPFKDGIQINQYDLDGRQQGMWFDYYDEENTEIFRKGQYKNDIKVGNWKQYHYSGELCDDYIFSNTGRRIGKWKTYNSEGNITKIAEYKNNLLTQVITYHNSDKIRSITNYKNNKPNGLKTTYHENGKLDEKMLYIDNKIDKWSVKYSKTGKLIRIIQRTSPNDSIEYLLSKNAKKNKIVIWRYRTIRQLLISQEEMNNIINQAKSEAPFQI
jgi:antitoxin component YwqK of YwqJK toxin-antitoxin module